MCRRYVPFCDSVPSAQAPSWVAAEAEEEPLRVGGVIFEPGVAEALAACWKSAGKQASGLYQTAHEFQELVVQVLSRDIRSVHQRSLVPAAGSGVGGSGGAGGGRDSTGSSSSKQASSGTGGAATAGQGCGPQVVYHVVLCGIDVSYVIDATTGALRVMGAQQGRSQEQEGGN